MTDDFEAIAELSAATAAELAASAIAARGKAEHHCHNCNTPLIGPYCAACGQPTDTHRKSIWVLIWETIKHLLDFDSRTMRTVRALLLEPGELPRAFKDGQTQRYLPAPRLYLFVSLIFFLVLSISGIAILQFEINMTDKATFLIPENGMGLELANKDKSAQFAEIHRKAVRGELTDRDIEKIDKNDGVTTHSYFFAPLGSVHSRIPKEARERLAKLELDEQSKPPGTDRWLTLGMLRGASAIADNPAAINGPLTAWIPRVLFLLLPVFAILLWLFYWRQRKKFLLVDHLVFSLTLHTFAFVILMFAALAVQVAPADAVGWAALIVIVAYFYMSMRWFYGQNYFWTTAKFLVIGFIYTFFILIPALAVVLFASIVGA